MQKTHKRVLLRSQNVDPVNVAPPPDAVPTNEKAQRLIGSSLILINTRARAATKVSTSYTAEQAAFVHWTGEVVKFTLACRTTAFVGDTLTIESFFPTIELLLSACIG